MGGLARAAGESGLSEPTWLVGGAAALAIAPRSATLWLVDIDDRTTRERAEAIALLPGEAASVADRADAGERLLRRRLARLLLGAAIGRPTGEVAIGRSAAGAPRVQPAGRWCVSLAARWPACLIGIAPFAIGVDIERVESAPLPPDLLTPAERETFAALQPAERTRAAARCWAAKEAHAKWTGTPREVDPVTVDTTGPLVASRWGATRCFRRDWGDHAAAACFA